MPAHGLARPDRRPGGAGRRRLRVPDRRRPQPPGRRRRDGVRRTAATAATAASLGAFAATGCGSGARSLPEPPAPTVASLRDPLLVAQASSRPRQPSRLLFSWSVREPDFRGAGAGVARVEPPDRARLDLFLDNGETAGVAVLVGDELRIPTAVSDDLIPPPPLLWAVFGVFRPGLHAAFVDGAVADGTLTAEYALPAAGRVRFRVEGGTVREAELVENGRVVERVEASDRHDGSYPAEAAYRNLPAYREVKLELESFEYVDPFPPDIWSPSGP